MFTEKSGLVNTFKYSSFGLVDHLSDQLTDTQKSFQNLSTLNRNISKSTSRLSGIYDGSSVVIAIAEGRGLARGEIGITSVDLMSPLIILSQFSDSQTYAKLLTKINALCPSEIIMPNTTCESSSANRLYNLICENFPNIIVTQVQRKYFNDAKGLDYIKQLCIIDYSKCIIELTSKYYCLAACAALLKYIEFIKNIVYAPHSIPVIFQGAEKTVIIDPTTCKYLELITNARNSKSNDSLYGTLNYTKTRSGARLLRANILQPPYDLETIQCRLDTVEELMKNEDLFYGLKSILTQFLDVEHLLSLFVQLNKCENVKDSENKILNTLYLKHTLELVEPFREILGKFNSKLIKAYFNALNDERFESIKLEINKIIEEDAKYQKGILNIRIQKCFAIKREVNGLLDITRRTFIETINDINDYVTTIAEKEGLPIKLGFSSSKGYHMQIFTKGQQSNVKLLSEFIKIIKTKNSITFTSDSLSNLNDRINQLTQNIYAMSNSILNDLFIKLRKNFGCLYKLIESISTIDMLQSFAHIAILYDYVRPEYGETLAIKNGCHPILLKISKETPITNNIYLSKETSFILLTGTNMSGKSTYLRKLAMLQIMSQIGSFIPATYASIRLTTQIFTRIGTDDHIEFNSSSFEQEMIEINYILNNFTDNSLILIDELCRSTNKDEGLAISMAICEHMIKSNAFVIFATHLHELTCLDTMYSKVVNYYLLTDITKIDNQSKLIHRYLLKKGICEIENYGLHLAEITCLPIDLINDTKCLLESFNKNQKKIFELTNQDLKKRCLFKLYNHLLQCARNNEFDDTNLINYLNDLKICFEDEYNLLMS